MAETQLNKLADALGLDPVELRRRNLLREGDTGTTQTPPAPGRQPARGGRRLRDGCGVGRAAARARPADPLRIARRRPATAAPGPRVRLRLQERGLLLRLPRAVRGPSRSSHGEWDDDRPTSADLHHAGAEVGQGAHTALLQMAAEAIGIPVDDVHGHFSDTADRGRLRQRAGISA